MLLQRGESQCHPSRVEQSAQKILDVLAKNGSLATFFTVGSAAEKFPGLIQLVVRAGHELGCPVVSIVRYFLSPALSFMKIPVEPSVRLKMLPVRMYWDAVLRAFQSRRTQNGLLRFPRLGFSHDSSIYRSNISPLKCKMVPAIPSLSRPLQARFWNSR